MRYHFFFFSSRLWPLLFIAIFPSSYKSIRSKRAFFTTPRARKSNPVFRPQCHAYRFTEIIFHRLITKNQSFLIRSIFLQLLRGFARATLPILCLHRVSRYFVANISHRSTFILHFYKRVFQLV